MCPVPPKGTQAAELSLMQANDFGRNYQMFEVTYKLDDCMLFQSRDTALLRKEKVDIGKHVLPAGDHQLQVIVRFHSDFGADMHDYEWWSRQGGSIRLQPESKLSAMVRFYEEEASDPRERMRFAITLADGAGQTAAVESEPRL